MSLGRALFLRTLCGVRRRFRTALRNVLGGPALRRRRMFIMLRDGREQKQNANCKESENVLHSFNPPQFEPAKHSNRG